MPLARGSYCAGGLGTSPCSTAEEVRPTTSYSTFLEYFLRWSRVFVFLNYFSQGEVSDVAGEIPDQHLLTKNHLPLGK